MKHPDWKQYRTFIGLMLVALLFASNNVPTQGQSSPPEPVADSPADALRSLHFITQVKNGNIDMNPTWVSVDSSGTVYVSDSSGENVKAFSPAGVLLHTYGAGKGNGIGQFDGPEGVVVVGNDVFIVDVNNDRIEHFNKTTEAFISQFGTFGTGLNQLKLPIQMAYNPANGLLYVVESNNARVQMFNTAGISQGTFGSLGQGLGQFAQPVGIAIDPLGYVYVSNSGAPSRIQKFSATGTFIRAIGTSGTGDGQFQNPYGLAVDRAGFLYVADRGNGRIQKFDWKGDFVAKYGPGKSTVCNNIERTICNGYFNTPEGIAITNDANAQPILYVADTGNGTVQAYETSLQSVTHPFKTKWGSSGTGPGQFNDPFAVAVDSASNTYIADFANQRIQKFDSKGVFIRQWGSVGTAAGQFHNPTSLAINSANNVFVVDSLNSRIQEFDSNGTFIRQWGSAGTDNGQFQGPFGIAVDANFVYTTESGASGNRIQKFDFTGAFVNRYGQCGTNCGQLTCPTGIAVDAIRQLIYVAGGCNNRVQAFTTIGNPLNLFDDLTTGPGALSNPRGIAIDQRGNVYVVDTGHNRIVQFTDNGQFVGTFGSFGRGDGQFDAPVGIALDRNSGQIFVTDLGGQRVQRFGATNPQRDTVGVWRPSTRTFFLRNSNTTGTADISVDTSNFAQSTDKPVVGDWNGDGVSTVGVFRNGLFLLRDSNLPGSPDYTFALGVAGDVPIVGDWNADGKDGVGVFRPSNGLIFLKNDLTTGFADTQMVLGTPGDIGVNGDWNADGQDSPGVRRPSNIQFFLSDKVLNGSVFADYSLLLGASTDVPFTGDWVHQGTSGVGVFRPSNGLIFLKNNLTPGFADTQITLGIAGDVPVAGNWGQVPGETIPAIAPAVTMGQPTVQPTPRLAPTFVPSAK